MPSDFNGRYYLAQLQRSAYLQADSMAAILRFLFIFIGLVVSASLVSAGELAHRAADDKPIRIGIIGLDSSHVVAFTQLLNDPSSPEHVPGARVVAAFKGGSADVEASSSRIEKFTAEMKNKWAVELVDSVEELCRKVDAIVIASVDGRTHLEQARLVFAAKKRVKYYTTTQGLETIRRN
ncbi:MAG TPA: hypothetical protein VOA41_09955 [Candidatus Dormibacteraeota bacterium]|nr:hypothetical protein [Candidatus Dormibacteraeota bacterium]